MHFLSLARLSPRSFPQDSDVVVSLFSLTSFPGSLFSASLSRWNRLRKAEKRDPGNEVVFSSVGSGMVQMWYMQCGVSTEPERIPVLRGNRGVRGVSF